MKPRRWYSSPELSPTTTPDRRARLPEPIYWAFTTRTRCDQGPIIRAAPADAQAAQQRRDAARTLARPPRLIDAA
jgi:hypothetical protein